MRILVDMDGVLSDLEGGFLKRWRERHPDKPYIPLAERTAYVVVEQYPAELRPLAREVCYADGFFRELEPIPGGINALREMEAMGMEVFICTSPLPGSKRCVMEKYDWVEAHLGAGWLRRMVMTGDKTIVRGEVLIDDRPEVAGVDQPTWEHIIYDQPYNRGEMRKRRLTWENWREVLLQTGGGVFGVEGRFRGEGPGSCPGGRT